MNDFKLSEDGDLVLGQQATDAQGYLLYYQVIQGEKTEIYRTKDPELGNIPVRDIGMVYGEEGDLQLIKSRLQTDSPDWHAFPQLGANLSDLMGLPNIQSTAARLANQIKQSLTYDGAFGQNELSIEVAPVGPTTLFVDIKVERRNDLIRYPGIYELSTGTWNEYDLYANQ